MGGEEYAANPGLAVLITDMGVSPAVVLRRAGLPGDLLTRGAATMSAQEYFALWMAIEEESGDPAPAVLMGRSLSAEAFDPLLFAAICSANLNLAALRIGRFKRLLGPLRVEVSRTSTETTIADVWPRHPEVPQGLVLAHLLYWVALVRLATRLPVRPLRMEVPQPPADAGAYRDYLGVPVTAADRPSVTFSADDAARPFVTVNSRMWEFFEPELRLQLSHLDAGASVSDRACAVLRELLPAGETSVQGVARMMRMSVRTLQRHLRQEGTSFQVVLQSTREALARHYLANPSLSVTEIALLLGYDDPNSFYRAFRSWTGATPQGIRAAARV